MCEVAREIVEVIGYAKGSYKTLERAEPLF